MYFEVKENAIAKLFCDEENIILPWGVETADDSSFFSLEKGIGWRTKILTEKYVSDSQNYQYEISCKMNNGLWRMFGEDKIVQDSVIRNIELECLESTLLMDFVLRFRFKQQLFQYACINEEQIYHSSSNIYHQYPVNNVMLHGDKYRVNISIEDCYCSEKMRPEMYVRDASNEWVVHARMMPNVDEVKIIKLCNAWYKTKPLPHGLNEILCSNKIIYDYLRYHNERQPYKSFIMQNINPNAFPMVWLEKGTKIYWKVKCSILTSK